MTYRERCAIAQNSIPESQFKIRLTALHNDMLDELDVLVRLANAADACVHNPAWAGICDEDIKLEIAVKRWLEKKGELR